MNRSTRDAVGVKVTLYPSIPGGPLVFPIREIPAGKSLVVASGPSGFVGKISNIETSVRVRRMVRHARVQGLLGISDVRIDRKRSLVKAVLTNTLRYPITLQKAHSSDAFAVVYDASGRIIGAGENYLLHGPTLKPGDHLPIIIYIAAPMPQVVRAQVSAVP